MGWLIALAVVMGIGWIPLGAQIHYDEDGFLVRVIASFLRFTVFPMPGKKKPKEKKPKASPQKASGQPKQSQPAAEKKGGKLSDFLPLAKVALDLLNDFRRKLRVDDLRLKLILAGDDPCDVAIGYGRAWEAVGNLMPLLERVFVIGKRDVEVECDFESTQTRVIFHMDITVTIGRMLSLAAVYGIRLLIEFIKLQKKRKGGAPV